MRRNKYIICILVFLLLFSACAPKAERVSDEELKALRKQYPYNDAVNEVVDWIPADLAYPDFASWIYREEPFSIHTVAVLKPVGEWTEPNHSSDPVLREAKIEEVLWTRGSVKTGDGVKLSLGSKFTSYGMEFEKVYAEGERLVCILFERPDAYGEESVFAAGKAYTFYLTKQDVLLSVSSAPGPDSVSGMYLHAFKTLMAETLGKSE